MRRVGPPRERYRFGPRCGEVSNIKPELGNLVKLGPNCGERPIESPPFASAFGSGAGETRVSASCLYRPLCRGYAPIDSPTVIYKECEGTVEEHGIPSSEFLFILEALGPDEVALGRNAVGPPGNLLDKLLRENTPLSRSDITLVNPVRCRPIVYEAHDPCKGRGCAACDNGQVPATLDYNSDHVTMKPSFDQVRECASRYFDKVLEDGDFKYIVCLGATAVYAMFGRAMEIGKYRGTIFEPGITKICSMCHSVGTVEGKLKNCTACKGKGHPKCRQCGGVSKHKKKCEYVEFGFPPSMFPCPPCASTGQVPGKPKKCAACDGAG